MNTWLLKSMLNDAINEPDEETRDGIFWCSAPKFDICMPIVKEIFYNEQVNSIGSNECCNIIRNEKGFLVEDIHGGVDTFTLEEMRFFIELWDKSQLRDYKLIQLPEE